MEDRCGGLHLAAGDAQLVEELQLPPQLAPGDLAAEQLAVARERPGDLAGVLVDELHAEAAGAEGEQAGDVVRPALGAVVEDGVPAAGVGPERELGPDPVAQRDPVRVSRPAAVAVVLPA